MYLLLVCQVAEPQVSRLCVEAEEFIAMEKWLELASLMVTSAELIFSKVSEKGRILPLLDLQSTPKNFIILSHAVKLSNADSIIILLTIIIGPVARFI